MTAAPDRVPQRPPTPPPPPPPQHRYPPAMDGNHFNPSYMQSYQTGQQPHQPGLASYANLSAANHQHESPSHATLPPLQNQHGGYQYGNLAFAHPGAQSQTPTAPHTPVSSSMNASNSNHYPHMSPTTAPPGSMLPPSNYPPPYAPPQSMQYPSSTASSMPPASASMGLPTIRPMPPGGVGSAMNGLPSLSTGQLGQTQFLQNEEAPTHVVGSQGRRGILPSAPGRPNPPAQGSTQSAKSMIPQKDAEGKFPCPHCNKTYLHAKHLKRHLLRRKYRYVSNH